MADLLRVSINGVLPGGEVWSVNPVFALGGDFGGVSVSQGQAQTIANAFAARVVSTGITQCWTAETRLTGYRVEARTKAGLLQAQADGIRGSAAAGSGVSAHPFQTSVVTSLRTAQPGPSGRGRLYWPATGLSMQTSTLRISSSFPASIGLGVKTLLSGMLTDISATLAGGVGLVVWSRKNSALYPVNSIQVGDIMDVQRRRRDTLIEAVSATTFP